MGASEVRSDGEPLVIEESPNKHLALLLVLSASMIALLAIAVVERGLVGLLSIILFVTSVGPSLWRFHLAQNAPAHSRIDAEGVHWETGLDLPWRAVVEVQVGHDFDGIRPLRRLHLRPNMVSFVTATQAGFAARAKVRPTGHAIFTRNLTVTAEQVAEAVHRFSDVPITRR